MIGGMTGVSRDVIPYGLSTGNRNYLNGVNVVGLRRNKIPNNNIIKPPIGIEPKKDLK